MTFVFIVLSDCRSIQTDNEKSAKYCILFKFKFEPNIHYTPMCKLSIVLFRGLFHVNPLLRAYCLSDTCHKK